MLHQYFNEEVYEMTKGKTKLHTLNAERIL